MRLDRREFTVAAFAAAGLGAGPARANDHAPRFVVYDDQVVASAGFADRLVAAGARAPVTGADASTAWFQNIAPHYRRGDVIAGMTTHMDFFVIRTLAQSAGLVVLQKARQPGCEPDQRREQAALAACRMAGLPALPTRLRPVALSADRPLPMVAWLIGSRGRGPASV